MPLSITNAQRSGGTSVRPSVCNEDLKKITFEQSKEAIFRGPSFGDDLQLTEHMNRPQLA